MDKILENKVIVVSGGTKGIGKGIIIESAKQGAHVVIGGRDKKAAETILDEVYKTGSEGIFVYTDPLNAPDDCAKLFDETIKKFGKVDGFVNYAGLLPTADLFDSTPELFDEVFHVNVRAALLCCKSCIAYMRRNNGGSIVLIGSPHAWCGEKDRTIYAISKGALFTLSEHIARHYAVDKVRCNFVTMGWVPTEGELAMRKKRGMDNDQLHEFAKNFIPMGRMQEVEDHIPGILYLLSDYSAQVTGANLRITGGFYI